MLRSEWNNAGRMDVFHECVPLLRRHVVRTNPQQSKMTAAGYAIQAHLEISVSDHVAYMF